MTFAYVGTDRLFFLFLFFTLFCLLIFLTFDAWNYENKNSAYGLLINVRSVSVAGEITGIEVNGKTNRVYLTINDNRTDSEFVSVIDSTTGRVISTIPFASCPSLSYDGVIIAFQRDVTNSQQLQREVVIGRISNDGNNISELVSIGADGCPSLSPDGKKVAYSRDEEGRGHDYVSIYVADLANLSRTSSEVLVLKDRECDECHVINYGLSDDSEMIVYNRYIENDDSVQTSIVLTDTTGENIPGLIAYPRSVYHFESADDFTYYKYVDVPYGSLSANSSSVAFHDGGEYSYGGNQNDNEIFIVNKETPPYPLDGPVQITENNGKNDHHPQISHDGTQVVYWSNNDLSLAKKEKDGNWTSTTIIQNATDDFTQGLPIYDIDTLKLPADMFVSNLEYDRIGASDLSFDGVDTIAYDNGKGQISIIKVSPSNGSSSLNSNTQLIW